MVSVSISLVMALFAVTLAALLAACWLGARIAGRTKTRPLAPPAVMPREAEQRPAANSPTAADNRHLADDLDAAIVRGQLFLVHQPKLRSRTGTMESAETLVRWRHPQHGLIGPSDFIAMAEQRGEIRRITEWVIRQSIAEQRSLAACGHRLSFSVNISAYLLADRDFAEWTLETIRAADAPISLEITETAMIVDPAGALRNLHMFADAGIRIAIDDYGAGLSSLAYLKQLPANELKIDRMFISGLSTSHRDPLLVRSTIDLAHALEMEVTAEGVDSAASMALLRVMGCDLMQGFLIAQPMTLGELRAFLDTRESGDEVGAPVAFPWTESRPVDHLAASEKKQGGLAG